MACKKHAWTNGGAYLNLTGRENSGRKHFALVLRWPCVVTATYQGLGWSYWCPDPVMLRRMPLPLPLPLSSPQPPLIAYINLPLAPHSAMTLDSRSRWRKRERRRVSRYRSKTHLLLPMLSMQRSPISGSIYRRQSRRRINAKLI